MLDRYTEPSMHQIYKITKFLAEIAIVLAVVTCQSEVVFATLSTTAIFEKARSLTVRISSRANLGSGRINFESGSGVIIGKQGDTYTVLTNQHVVCLGQPTSESGCPKDITYTIRTYDDKDYSAVRLPLLSVSSRVDLSILQFKGSREYPVADLGDSGQAAPGSGVHIFGFPKLRDPSAITPSFASGYVTALTPQACWGYALVYSAFTGSGMSGSPIFDDNGRVIGIHGYGKRSPVSSCEQQIDLQAGSGRAGDYVIESGERAGIPLRKFIELVSNSNLPLPELKIDTTPVDRSPDFTKAINYYNEGLIRLSQKDYSGAIQSFGEAIESNPNFAEAYFNRGNVWMRKGDLEKAIKDWKNALQWSNEVKPIAYYNIGLAHFRRNRLEQAIEAYKAAITSNRDYAPAYYSLGNVYSSLAESGNRTDRADLIKQTVKSYTEAIAIDSSYAEAFFNRGIAYLNLLKDRSKAIADIEQAAQLFLSRNDTRRYDMATDYLRQLRRQ